MKTLKKIESQLYLEDQSFLSEYEIQQAVYERSLKKGNAGNMVKPIKPRQRRLMVDDITIEALVDVLIDNPKGILVVKDELSGFIGSFDAYKNSKNGGKDRAAYLELYNGGPKMIDRVNRGRMHVPNWSACIIGGIQPGPMKRVMGKIDDDGLLQRFVPIFVGKKGNGADRPPNQEALHAFYQIQERLSRMQVAPNESENSRAGFSTVKFFPEAQKCRKMVMDTVNRVMILPDTSSAFKGHLSKYDGLFARIALTFHVVEHLSEDSMCIPGMITGKTAMMTAKFMLNYLLPNAARFYSELIGSTEHFGKSRWIAGYILSRKSEKVTAREIGRAYRGLRDDPEEINRAMNTLWVTGWVHPIRYGKNNLATGWSVDPRVHEIFAERAEMERKRREVERLKVAEAVKDLGLNSPGGAE